MLPRFVIPIPDLVTSLLRDHRWAPHVVAQRVLPAQPARLADWPDGLHPAVRAAAEDLGMSRLYTHQAEAVAAVLEGRHVAVSTGTASGKSLCYLLPVMDALLRDPGARALFIFPTKALAHDQLATLRRWDAALPELALKPGAYDGDTPAGQRGAVRRQARVILTNPDMLHAGILPHHTSWAALFEGLTHVVLDEMHVYRGVFGSHVANVMRRLRRVARFHGAAPRFVLTSATIANPAELARILVGAETALVEEDGAPRGRRSFLFYNPPVVDETLGVRRSPLLESEALARHFLAGGVQTIVFARSRQAAELIRRYVSEGLANDRRHVTGQLTPLAGEAEDALVRGYRGGYTAGERREIEAGLRSGSLRGVVATNALELGIDIGELDACIMAGYPGTIASTWQQAGRAGRQALEAATVLVAGSSPLDQFLMRHPDYFFQRSPEHARLHPDNLLLLLDHVRCAAFELPFEPAEAARPFGAEEADAWEEGGAASGAEGEDEQPQPAPREAVIGELAGATSSPTGDVLVEATVIDTVQEDPAGSAPIPTSDPSSPPDRLAPLPVADLLAVLEAQGTLSRSAGIWYWLADAYPAEAVNLRQVGPTTVTIIRRRSPDFQREEKASPDNSPGEPPFLRADVLGTVERSAAPVTVHPGAVYLHDGQTYLVESLDWEQGRAYVVPTDGSLYTRASSRTAIQPTQTLATRAVRGAQIGHGELEVRTRATSFRQVRFRTHETLGWGKIDLPEQTHVAGGYWLLLDDGAVEALKAIGRWHFDATGDRGPNWSEQRDLARARDDFRCRLCNAAEPPERSHDVHHIRPFREFGWEKGKNDLYRQANLLDNLITLCRACHHAAERALGLHGALSGVGYALAHVAPLFLMCDPRDIGVATESHTPWSKRPTIAIYERAAAGVGFGEMLYELHESLIRAAEDLIAGCPCVHGCPACVGPADGRDPEAKAHARAVLAVLR